MPGQVLQINVSLGGVPKLSVPHAELGSFGITGDKHRFPLHGGPSQALLLLASEVVQTLQSEGWPVFFGALGENLTTQGLDHRQWRTSQRYRVGAALIQLTQPRVPCRTLNPYGAGIQKRLYDKRVKNLDPASIHWGESGFYASVVRGGRISAGDIIEAVDLAY